ncbi:hypothetical protein Q7P37_004349 [Cladosporium fusiforme]
MESGRPTARVSRKRKRSGDVRTDDSDDGSKKRGRPRTDKADESAADRRRTQIRMAQRAYRQRKETTLDDLRKRVSDLTTIVECMNKAFGDCRDRLVSTGLPERHVDELAEVTVRFAGFMDAVRRPGDPEVEVLADGHLDTQHVNHVSRPAEDLVLVPSGKNVSSWIDQATLSHVEKPSQPDVGLGYTMYMPEAFDELANNFNIPSLAQAMALPQQKSPPSNPFESRGPNAARPHSLSLETELNPPQTYSFHEKTLARRLHRACLEGAYQLLLDPGRRPHTFDRVFKLSLLSRDKARMATSIKRILDRGVDEPLEFWDAPLIHIGGAGTHYPRREPLSQPPEPRKPVFHLGIIGPQMLNLLENVVQARPAVDISIEIAGFEGEWFDPYDIEGYLASKGVHIDPMVSFVEAEITDFPSDSGTISSNSSTRNSGVPGSQSGASYWDPEQWSELQRMDADAMRWQDVGNASVSGLGNVGYSDTSTGSWLNLQPADHLNGKGTSANMSFHQAGANVLDSDLNGFAQVTPPSLEPQRKVVIIDVGKFVKVLTVTGVCLGRTPGFKRKDVDRALAISSFDAF